MPNLQEGKTDLECLAATSQSLLYFSSCNKSYNDIILFVYCSYFFSS